MTTPFLPFYREIPLTQGQFALVDEIDYEFISQWKWYADWSDCTKSFYAMRWAAISRKPYKQAKFSMHRVILGLERGDKRRGDHISGNTLDNRRFNLRICTHRQNVLNSKMQWRNTSGFKGVNWDHREGKWRARITDDGRRVHLGRFETAEDAYAAYCDAAKKLHGEFARL